VNGALQNEISKYLGRAKWDPDYTPGLDLNFEKSLRVFDFFLLT
jgi:hypothetical protein